MKKETLIEFVQWYKKNEKDVYLMSPEFMVETYLNSINEASNESLSVSDNEHGGNICPVCNGTGIREDKDVTSGQLSCLRCYGTGRI